MYTHDNNTFALYVTCFRTEETETSFNENVGTLKFVDFLTNMTNDEDESIIMRCKVVGDPPPTKFQWFKDKVQITAEPGKIVIRKIPARVNILFGFMNLIYAV